MCQMVRLGQALLKKVVEWYIKEDLAVREVWILEHPGFVLWMLILTRGRE